MVPISSDNICESKLAVSNVSEQPASLYDSSPCNWPCKEFLHQTPFAGNDTFLPGFANRCRVCEALYSDGALLISPPIHRD